MKSSFEEILKEDKLLYNYYHNAPTELSKKYVKLYIMNNQLVLDALEEKNENIESDKNYIQSKKKQMELRNKFGVIEWQWEIDGFCNHLQSIGGKMYKAHCIEMINKIKENKKQGGFN